MLHPNQERGEKLVPVVSGRSIPVLWTQSVTSAVMWRAANGGDGQHGRTPLSINHLRVAFNPFIFMNPTVLVGLRPRGMVSCLGDPVSLVKWASRTLSKYTLTSRRCAMNVMEDARNRVKSSIAGIGAGSRRSISNVVHESLVSLGRLPRRANNFLNVSTVIPRHKW